MNRSEAREALIGPVPSLRIPFCRDGSIDYRGLKNSIDFDLAAGAKTILLTYGDSLFSVLTDREVAEITQKTVEFTAGRAVVVAAERQWWTGKVLEFAKYCREIGVNILMVLPPDWAGSCTRETLVEHYAAVSEQIPMMIVTAAFGGRPADGLKIMEILRDKSPGFVAVKDDLCGQHGRQLCLLLNKEIPVFAGGQKQNHLNVYPYGCDGYLSTYLKFKPDIAHIYWTAIEKKDLAEACRIIDVYDRPFFDLIMSLPGNFDAGFHGTMEVFGIFGRWRRKPYYSLNDAEMEKLKDFFKQKALM